MMISDGGPAFPIERDAIGEPLPIPYSGMTMRDYFAAHAPAPADWFVPVMSTPRPKAEWVDARYKNVQPPDNEAAIDAWDAERKKQRAIQWPWVWADLMLDQRSIVRAEYEVKS